MKKASRIICIVLCFIMLLCVCACGEGGGKKSGEKKTMTLGTANTFLGNFLYGQDAGQCDSAISLVFDYVFEIDPITKEVSSKVLTDWHYEDDLTFVCTIRPGVTFSNGVEATAEDVLWSVGEFFDRHKFDTIFGPLNMEKSHVKEDDKYTAVFVFDGPYGPGLIQNFLVLYNKAWCQEKGWDSEDWYYNPLGSGPYKCAEYVTDSLIRLELRDDYWDKQEYTVDTWIIKYYPDSSTMFMDLQLGELDLCTGIGDTDYTNYKKSPIEGIKLHSVDLNDVQYFALAYKYNEAFSNINVRKAIAHAVDWDAVGEMGHGEWYVQPQSMVTKSSPYHIDVGHYEYNPELAKQALADSGYKPGELEFRMFTMQNPAYKAMGEGIQYYLDQIGIKLNLEFGDIASVIGAWLGPNGTEVGFQNNPIGTMVGEPQLCWSPMMINYAPFQHTVCTDAKFNELAEAALLTVDQNVRKANYAEAQQYIFDNYLTFPISEYAGAVAYRDGAFPDDVVAHNAYSLMGFNLRTMSLAR